MSELLAMGLPTKKVLRYVAEQGYNVIHENFEGEAWMGVVPTHNNPRFEFTYEFTPTRELLTKWANCGSPTMSVEWHEINQAHELQQS